jgi:hypothetical protein
VLKLGKSFVRAILGDRLTYSLRQSLGYAPRAFHNDPFAIKLVDELIKRFKPTSFAETGLFQGGTTQYMANRYPQLPIHSFEVSKEFYENGCRKFSIYPNVKLHLGSSDVALREALEKNVLGDLPLFYLDAHWYDYWPLRDEIRLIGDHLKTAIILIDDFEVPGRPEFTFDVEGKREGVDETAKCNLDYIKSAFSSKHTYRFFSPNYDSVQSGLKELVGYGLIFQNIDQSFIREFSDNSSIHHLFREIRVS